MAPLVLLSLLALQPSPDHTPAWATTDDLRALAAPLALLRAGCRIEPIPALDHLVAGTLPWGVTPEIEEEWAERGYTPTSCAPEYYQLVETDEVGAVVLDPAGVRHRVVPGGRLGGRWHTSGWSPEWTVRHIEHDQIVLVDPGGAETRVTRSPGLPLPAHSPTAAPPLDALWTAEIRSQGLRHPPAQDLLQILLSSRRDLSRVDLGCTPGGRACLLRADSRRLEYIARFMVEAEGAGMQVKLVEVETIEVENPPRLPCHRGDRFEQRVFMAWVNLP